MVGGSVMRDASGNIMDLFNIYNGSILRAMGGLENQTSIENETYFESIPEKTWSIYGTSFNCTPPNCPFGTHNSFQVTTSNVFNLNILFQLKHDSRLYSQNIFT